MRGIVNRAGVFEERDKAGRRKADKLTYVVAMEEGKLYQRIWSEGEDVCVRWIHDASGWFVCECVAWGRQLENIWNNYLAKYIAGLVILTFLCLDGYARDVTARYAKNFGAHQARARARVAAGGKNGKAEWWDSVMRILKRPYALVSLISQDRSDMGSCLRCPIF